MSNDLKLMNEDKFNNNIEIIFTAYETSMFALSTQDIQRSEESLMKAKNAFKFISIKAENDIIVPFKIMCDLIEISTRILKSFHYSCDERYKKALEELESAKISCDQTTLNFNNISNEIQNYDIFSSIIPISKIMISAYSCIVNSQILNINSQILSNEGKFIDEIKNLEQSIKELRKINTLNFEEDEIGISISLISMVNRIADMNERKMERLIEKRKKINFLTPIDRKVFIVHGHNTSILRELTSMLKNSFEITPVILSDMPDNGNTLIEKFENYARMCAFAFIIFTPDDFVTNKGRKYFQGRSNVIFELGWFCGRFGRDKVRILRQKDTPLPSDLNGLVTIDFHESLEEVFRRINADLEYNGILNPLI
ncbi:nucleotide-binding protein [uncultured Akkermansia sp.]|jgi:predicted nucleotide-binding protein|uniref:nucleotide-binding protein n=1 Tax=uncultured Akkermansia sp. TaxID=512294 RepID=UPI0025E549C1|nr:nucleotide-binding protein [uncultured Akkermansia sp.]